MLSKLINFNRFSNRNMTIFDAKCWRHGPRFDTHRHMSRWNSSSPHHRSRALCLSLSIIPVFSFTQSLALGHLLLVRSCVSIIHPSSTLPSDISRPYTHIRLRVNNKCSLESRAFFFLSSWLEQNGSVFIMSNIIYPHFEVWYKTNNIIIHQNSPICLSE